MYMEGGGKTPLILDLGMRRRWMFNFTLRSPYCWDKTLVHNEKMGAGWESKTVSAALDNTKSLHPPGSEHRPV